MVLVNETGQAVFYSISTANMADCGTIDVDGIADLPGYDNQTNVQVSFAAATGYNSIGVTIPQTQTGNQVEMTLVAE